jgi:hypothetical protein
MSGEYFENRFITFYHIHKARPVRTSSNQCSGRQRMPSLV